MPPSCSARARAGLSVLDDIRPGPLRPCLCATRSDKPDGSAKPAGREALTAGYVGSGRDARDGSAPGRKRSGRAAEGR